MLEQNRLSEGLLEPTFNGAIGLRRQVFTGMTGADFGAELGVILCPLVSTHVPSCPLVSSVEWRYGVNAA